MLRSIKREAEIAVLEYKKTLEADYQKQIKEKKAQIDRDAAGVNMGVSFEQLEGEYRKNRANVVELLLQNCVDVDLEIPRVVKGQFE